MEIIMLSNDVDNRKQAAAIGIKAMSVHVPPRPPPPPPPIRWHNVPPLRESEIAHQRRIGFVTATSCRLANSRIWRCLLAGLW